MCSRTVAGGTPKKASGFASPFCARPAAAGNARLSWPPQLTPSLRSRSASQNARTAADEEGQYGASSGTNPNLADIQNDAGNTYPSQADQGSTLRTPGAEGGRSSAATGASDPASAEAAAGDASANTQTPP